MRRRSWRLSGIWPKARPAARKRGKRRRQKSAPDEGLTLGRGRLHERREKCRNGAVDVTFERRTEAWNFRELTPAPGDKLLRLMRIQLDVLVFTKKAKSEPPLCLATIATL